VLSGRTKQEGLNENVVDFVGGEFLGGVSGLCAVVFL